MILAAPATNSDPSAMDLPRVASFLSRVKEGSLA